MQIFKVKLDLFKHKKTTQGTAEPNYKNLTLTMKKKLDDKTNKTRL